MFPVSDGRPGGGRQHRVAGHLHNGDRRLVGVRQLRVRASPPLHVHAVRRRSVLTRRHRRWHAQLLQPERHLRRVSLRPHGCSVRGQDRAGRLSPHQVPAVHAEAGFSDDAPWSGEHRGARTA